MFDHLIHADWSMDERKRWMTMATRQKDGWLIDSACQAASPSVFVKELAEIGQNGRLLVGFDFPIGVPSAYGVQTGFADFPAALRAFGEGDWSEFFKVADIPAEISLRRPFYPRVSRKGSARIELAAGLGVPMFADLLRKCERRTQYGPEGCVLFWTLGGNQVGKGALTGWREVIRPAMLDGARLWPFDGTLDELSQSAGVVLAETYPAEAYTIFDGRFLRSESKGRQVDRLNKAPAIHRWALANSVQLSPSLIAQIDTGFGPRKTGEDAFDAFAGIVKMIEVAERRRKEISHPWPETTVWEGWILGR
ncbi:DUF429 domain-containing protein [Ancylobacter sp. SL191]|uniref:DUF429 domain-containing protein n=1 Tax=Ancylobacter sp. SL191 TaxID=2995166 RepID=UPI00226F741B|nr:DUF429 domain-containing protein [Ancylobacter sp. SL191]WAC26859.1 DUF429 domain-containing protein [Ancylobacter sp. SL191]